MRVAVVECTEGMDPKQIHPRHKAVKRIVQTWECLYVGSTPKCQYSCALTEANALADILNMLEDLETEQDYRPEHMIPEDHES